MPLTCWASGRSPLASVGVEWLVWRHHGRLVGELFGSMLARALAFLSDCLEYAEAPFSQIPNVVLELGLRGIAHQQVKAERRRA